MTDSVAEDQLRSIVQRVERMNEEKDAINADISEIYKEARGNGFDVPAIKAILKIRKDEHAHQQREAIIDLYLTALGSRAPAHEGDR